MAGHLYLGKKEGERFTRYFIRRESAQIEDEKALEDDLEQAKKYEWRLRSRSTGHLKSTVYSRNFSFEVGQPASFEEQDKHPCAVEYLFGALAGSLATAFSTECAKENLEVDDIDVRTPEEYAFIGHPEMVWNIPFAFVTYQRKDGKTEYGPKMNPDFVAEVKTIAGLTDTLLLMCRSGGRSAKAVDKLMKAGFTDAYNIVDGFEGDKVKDPESVFYGKRMRNGWKNSAPWIYDIDPEKIILQEYVSKQTQ